MTTTAGEHQDRPVFGPVVQGGAAFGGLYHATDENTVRGALQAAWDIGIRAFDTAPHYGVGLSEERLGRFLVDQPRDAFVVSTKVGRLLVEDPTARTESDGFLGTPTRRRVLDYSAAGVRRSLEESLERMGLDRIDLVLIHDPEKFLDEAVNEAAPALSALRADGVIGGFGVGTNYVDTALRLVTETDLDTVMLAGRHTLLERGADPGLLAACAERGVDVLAAGPLNSGLLADPGGLEPHFNYEPAAPALVRTALALEATCHRYGVSLRAAALQFPLRHPAVSAVVLGPGTAAEVLDCRQQLDVVVPEELWAELEQVLTDHR